MPFVAVAGVAALVPSAARAADDGWQPFPVTPQFNDFGGVGLMQTPTARFAEDGTVSFTANRVWPYERYTVAVQATPWLEASLKYSSVANRLFSGSQEFSGNQTYKDRGIDVKIRLLDEGEIRPALAIGLRDFVGTGIFQSEYIVANKMAGPFDLSLGLGWGLLGTRGHFGNPLGLLSGYFDTRPGFDTQGGNFSENYFRGRRVALFGGVRYDTPIRGLTLVAEYDPNNYRSEALNNRLDTDFPINVGVNYTVASWLQVGASWQRGNRVGLRLTMSGSLNSKVRQLKIDPPPPQVLREGPAEPAAAAPVTAAAPAVAPEAAAAPAGPAANASLGERVAAAIGEQGSGLLRAAFTPRGATLYVVQGRFRDPVVGLGRIGRAAFSVLPASTAAIEVVFIEGGMQTMSVTLYREQFLDAIDPARKDTDSLLKRSTFAQAGDEPLPTDYVNPASEFKPRFFYGIRPGLRNTLGRPEQFILYQLWLRLNGAIDFAPGLIVTGSLGVNISNNFDKIRNGSDSLLPRVRSDIAEYLKQSDTSIPFLMGEYFFTMKPGLYGHVYAGLLEEMYAGVGGEVLYRPYDSNLAVGFDLNWVKQRGFNGFFGFRDYSIVTGHATISYNIPGPNITATVRAGRYLAGDKGVTFDVSRTFKSGARVGAFATFTNVSAAQFGEGSFDKGLYLTVPLDLFYVRNVRTSVGIAWRPLFRDGGQQLIIRNPLLGITETNTFQNYRRTWNNIGN